MLYLLLLVTLILIIGIVAKVLRGATQRVGKAALPYTKKEYLLSKAEKSFYLVLRQVVPDGFVVFPKVRVEDVIEVRRGTQERQGFRNRISAKHFDFIVCDRSRLSPLAAIELNDRSHNRPDRRDRDEFLADATQAAGLPFLQIPAADTYNTKVLAATLTSFLSPRA